MPTEQRGFRQVEILLANPWVRSDPIMTRIFQVVHRDEPSHFLPYQNWLERPGRATARWQERLTDFGIHRRLLFGRIPALFLDPALPRLVRRSHGVQAHHRQPELLRMEPAPVAPAEGARHSVGPKIPKRAPSPSASPPKCTAALPPCAVIAR